MKADHRRRHAVAWLLLAPLLLIGVYLADSGVARLQALAPSGGDAGD